MPPAEANAQPEARAERGRAPAAGRPLPRGPRGGSGLALSLSSAGDKKVVLAHIFVPGGFQICVVRAKMSLPRSPSMSSD